MEDYTLGFSVAILVISLGVLLTSLAIKPSNEEKKSECYEIYATDNVILKKCEKYFKKEKIKEKENGK